MSDRDVVEVSIAVLATAGASPGRTRGSGTGPVAAIANIPGRCRGRGIGPRSGSAVGRTSAAATCCDGRAGGGASRGAEKSGGLVVLGLGHAMARSVEALVEAVFSLDRCGAGCGSLGADGMVAVPVGASPAAAAEAVITGVGAGGAWMEGTGGLFAAARRAVVESASAETFDFLLSAGGLGGSLAAGLRRSDADGSGGAELDGAAEIAGTRGVAEATCSSAGTFGRAT